jgi:hypothetical protein
MNTLTSVKSSWFKNPDVLAREMTVRHNESLLRFENLSLLTALIILSVANVLSVPVLL